MIVLDTNIISELMRAVPDPRVLAWLVRQPMAGLFTTTLTQAEIFYGLRLLPEGRRRDDLMAAARPIFEIEMAGRILSFDGDAALAYPNIAAHRSDRRPDRVDYVLVGRAVGHPQRSGFRRMRDRRGRSLTRALIPEGFRVGFAAKA